MTSRSKQHDAAWRLARRTLDIFSNLLRPEEHGDALEELYSLALEELQKYETQLRLMEQRIQPLAKGDSTCTS